MQLEWLLEYGGYAHLYHRYRVMRATEYRVKERRSTFGLDAPLQKGAQRAYSPEEPGDYVDEEDDAA